MEKLVSAHHMVDARRMVDARMMMVLWRCR